MKTNKPLFQARIADTTLELVFYGDIGSSWFAEGITVATVKKSIDNAGAFSRVSARINSPGGDVFEGLAIGNLLRSLGKPIDVYIDGIAASSASIIAMAGDRRIMPKNALMMVHNAWTMIVGDAADMRKMADTLEIVGGSIATTYSSRTGLPVEEVKAMMDAETWLTADDCLAKGFATEVLAEESPAIANAKGFAVLSRLRNVPEALKDATNPGLGPNQDGMGGMAAAVECECDCQECQGGNCQGCTNTDCSDPDCVDCPMQDGAYAKADLLRMELQFRQVTRK